MTYEEMREQAREAGLKIERKKLLSILKRNHWSPQKAADELKISPSTLYRALERHPGLLKQFNEMTPPPGRVPKQ
jgi:transcriptional regulator of acetoin/glycerol metabolism